ncbi:hypothetical protein ONZ45_g17962 [Pleurotus djamor]|nr:hypothetical protein ONZ45_g17962 [Pleurotus djamor]
MTVMHSSILDALDGKSFDNDDEGVSSSDAASLGLGLGIPILPQIKHRRASDGVILPDCTDMLVSPRAVSSPTKSSSAKVVAGGFRLNYDTETPLRSIDVGGQDQQLKLAEFVTKAIDNLSNGRNVREAMEDLGLKDKSDLLPGLDVRLLPHQVIGVSWMLEQERGKSKGGILADDMGLGKTVQMIATMVMNQPDPDDDDLRTTLIVVPAALLQQWKEEIETKTNGIFTVHVHHGKDKLKTLDELYEKDMVITSYPTLCQDFWMPKDLEVGEEEQYLAREGGLLARAKFFRVVADEAQFIRNRATRASISLAYIRSVYRWMLTGTPITNTLADIYGLLRFGRFRPWNDWESFNAHVAKVQYEDAPLASQRAQAILQPHILRRTKTSTLEGEPILQLPPKDIELYTIDFSEEERDLYDSFEKRSKLRLSKFIKERTLVKNHAVVLVMILRLRQLCCHPNLILKDVGDYADPTLLVAGDAEQELGRALKFMGRAWVANVKQRFLTRAAATEIIEFADLIDEGDSTCPVCQDLYVENSGRVLECGHELCFECLLEISNSPLSHDGIFGYGTEKQNMEAEKAFENAEAKGLRPCPTCKKMSNFNAPNKVFKSCAFEPSDEELSAYAKSHRQASRKHRHSRYTIKDEDDDDDLEVGDIDMKNPGSSPKRFGDDLGASDDDDDDLPDASMIFTRPAKRIKKDEDAMSEDEPFGGLGVKDELTGSQRRKSGRPSGPSRRSSAGSSKPKAKAQVKRNPDDGPSDEVIAAWRKGDDDLEASAKMVAMIDILKKSGDDKTIVYSQCKDFDA